MSDNDEKPNYFATAPRCSQYGAPLGRHDVREELPEFRGRIYVSHVQLDGDYDGAGTYWGNNGTPIYWYATSDYTIDATLRVGSYADAVEEIRRYYRHAEYVNAGYISAKFVTEAGDPLPDIDDFARGYIECALWQSPEPDGEDTRPKYPSIGDIDVASIREMVAFCAKFCAQFGDMPPWEQDGACVIRLKGTVAEHAGYDFYLTHNRTGVSFTDGDWDEEIGVKLAAAAHAYSHERELMWDEDARLYYFEP